MLTGNTGVTGKVETVDGIGVELFILTELQRAVGKDELDGRAILGVEELLTFPELVERVLEGLGRHVDGTSARDDFGGIGGFVVLLGIRSSSGDSLFLEEAAGINREGAVGESEGRSLVFSARKDRKALVTRHREGTAVHIDIALAEVEGFGRDGAVGLDVDHAGLLDFQTSQVESGTLGDIQFAGALIFTGADAKRAGIFGACDIKLAAVEIPGGATGKKKLVVFSRALGLRVELRDVEDAVSLDRNALERVVGTPDGGVQTGVFKSDRFKGGSLTVLKREVGIVLQVKVCSNSGLAFLLFSLDLHRVDGAVELEGRLAGCKVNETVDIGLFTEVEGGRRSAVLDFNRGRTLGGSVDSAVVFKGVRGGVDQNAVSPLVLTLILVEDFADGDRAVIDADALDAITAEFEAGTLAFNDDPAVVLDGRR